MGRRRATRRRRPLRAGPLLIVAGVAVRACGASCSAARLTARAPGHPHVLAAPVLVPGAVARGGSHPPVEPVRDARLPVRRRPAERVALPPADGPVLRALAPASAIRAFIVFNPLLAGLGLYGFLRMEGSRRARGDGRRALARDDDVDLRDRDRRCRSRASLAWTTDRAAGRRRLSARPIGGRAGSRGWRWAAFAWSQVASAHLSHGLVMCTAARGRLPGGRRASTDVRGGAGRRGWSPRSARALFLGVPAARRACAVLIPRLAFIGSSSLQGGYDALGDARGARARTATPGPRHERRVGGVAARLRRRRPAPTPEPRCCWRCPLALRARARRALVVGVRRRARRSPGSLMLDAVVTAGLVPLAARSRSRSATSTSTTRAACATSP